MTAIRHTTNIGLIEDLMAAGCTEVVKPAVETPFSATALAALTEKVSLSGLYRTRSRRSRHVTSGYPEPCSALAPNQRRRFGERAHCQGYRRYRGDGTLGVKSGHHHQKYATSKRIITAPTNESPKRLNISCITLLPFNCGYCDHRTPGPPRPRSDEIK